MLSKERQVRIVNIVNEKTFVSINELIQEFGVSRSSIMRDLIELENQGLIIRERGGAMAKNISPITLTSFNESSVLSKESINVNEKQLICKKAYEVIKDGDCIYIDSGTTPVYLLDYIVNKQVTIVTSSIYLIRRLPDAFKGNVYILGGEFIRKYDMNNGSITLDMINQFNFNHAFFSTNGVNIDNGEVYIFEFSIGALKQAVMKRCSHNHLLIDDTKFNIKALCTWAKTDEFNTVYVNKFPEDQELPDNYIICEGEE